MNAKQTECQIKHIVVYIDEVVDVKTKFIFKGPNSQSYVNLKRDSKRDEKQILTQKISIISGPECFLKVSYS